MRTASAATIWRSTEVVVLPSLREWESRTFPGVVLTLFGRVQAARLTDEGRLQVDEVREGLRVRARSWVGVVRLDGVEIRIVPKLAGDHLGLVRLLESVSGLEGLTRLRGVASLQVVGDSLFDLVALLFVEACEGIIRRGLLAGYLEREEDLPIVRGRILADRQVLERFGLLDRIICRFDELEHDIDENRLLAATIRIAHRRVRTASVRRRLARVRAVMEPICDPTKLDVRNVRAQIIYDRLNSHYRQAHGLASMVLDALGIEDLLAPGDTRSFTFLLDMNLLFERFVEQLVRRSLANGHFSVCSQASHSSIIWNVTAHQTYARVRPDTIVESRDGPLTRVAIDAKYKLYDQRPLDQSDIYQVFLYAYAMGVRGGQQVPAALIIYPASSSETNPVRLQIRPLDARLGAEIVALGVPIPAALDELSRGDAGPILGFLSDTIRELLGCGG